MARALNGPTRRTRGRNKSCIIQKTSQDKARLKGAAVVGCDSWALALVLAGLGPGLKKSVSGVGGVGGRVRAGGGCRMAVMDGCCVRCMDTFEVVYGVPQRSTDIRI